MTTERHDGKALCIAECGCRLIEDNACGTLRFCCLHAAAPALLEACLQAHTELCICENTEAIRSLLMKVALQAKGMI